MDFVHWFLAPLFLHVLLIGFVGTRTVRARIASVMTGQTKLNDIATSNNAWNEQAKKLGNNFNNQFETPTLWYGVSALMVALSLVDGVAVVLSWLFLLSRVVHSTVHTGTNFVPLRMRVFLAGFACLFLLWGWFALRFFWIG